MIQDKAQSAGNGTSFSRIATPYWIIRAAPHFERTVQQSFAVLRLKKGVGSNFPKHGPYSLGAPLGKIGSDPFFREAVVCGVAPLGKDAPLPARRAWRFPCPPGATTSRLAELVITTLTEY